MDTIKINSKCVKMVAHRGASGLETENTLPAFVAAANRSYYGIECDVHITGDGKFAVIHDDDTLRVCGEKLIVEECAYDTLRELQLFNMQSYEKKDNTIRSDYFIPTLREYIIICSKYNKKAVLELKNAMSEENVHKICDEIKSLNYLENTVFISFDYDNLVYIKNYDTTLYVQYLTSSYDKKLLGRLISDKFNLDIHYKSVDKKLVDTLHENGLEINCWTVDKLSDAEKLIGLGVDYITSNILE